VVLKKVYKYLQGGIHSSNKLQGKVEAYNKILKNEFLAIEDIPRWQTVS
jgi:hypothetical protein